MTDPDATDDGPSGDTPDDPEVEPAFDIDLDPEDQGTAEAAAESSG